MVHACRGRATSHVRNTRLGYGIVWQYLLVAHQTAHQDGTPAPRTGATAPSLRCFISALQTSISGTIAPGSGCLLMGGSKRPQGTSDVPVASLNHPWW